MKPTYVIEVHRGWNDPGEQFLECQKLLAGVVTATMDLAEVGRFQRDLLVCVSTV